MDSHGRKVGRAPGQGTIGIGSFVPEEDRRARGIRQLEELGPYRPLIQIVPGYHQPANQRGENQIPLILQGETVEIRDPTTGVRLSDPDLALIRRIRGLRCEKTAVG